jgi:hypothetical protein
LWEELITEAQTLSTLILSDMTSKIRTVSMFVTESVATFMTNLHTKLHKRISYGSLVVGIKSETKHKLRAAAVLLFRFNKSCIFFRRSIIMYDFTTINKVALVWLPPHKFMHPPCCYYWLQEIRIYEVGMASSGILFVPKFVKIGPLMQTLNIPLSILKKTSRLKSSFSVLFIS